MVLMGHCHCKSPTPKYNPKNGGVEWRIGREAAGRWRALLEARPDREGPKPPMK